MILGYDDNFNQSFLLDTINNVPNFDSFTSITFGGTSAMTISEVWGQEEIYQNGQWVAMNEDYLDNYENYYMNTGWTDYTYILDIFNSPSSDGSTEAGVITGLGTITNWSLYRWDNNSNQTNYIGDFTSVITNYIDYSALKDITYQYMLYAKNNTVTSGSMVSATVTPDYYGYFLIDVTNNVVYKFDTNLSGGDITQNINYSAFQNNTKYQTYNVGDMQYISSSITALVRYANSAILDNNTTSLLKNLQDCIKDVTRIKILKTRKGRGWYVFTYDYKDAPINQAIMSQPINASFSFDEIGEL